MDTIASLNSMVSKLGIFPGVMTDFDANGWCGYWDTRNAGQIDLYFSLANDVEGDAMRELNGKYRLVLYSTCRFWRVFWNKKIVLELNEDGPAFDLRLSAPWSIFWDREFPIRARLEEIG